VQKFQAFVHSGPTDQLGGEEVRGFLSELAVRHGVAASTQNQAFNALLFFYRHVLRREFGRLDGVVRAKSHRYVPVVLSRPETEAVLGHLQPPSSTTTFTGRTGWAALLPRPDRILD
jgi:site-specific recombinase XerD